MRTSRIRGTRGRLARRALPVLVFGLALLGAMPAAGQQSGQASSEGQPSGPSLFLVDSETRVGALSFRFPSGSAIAPEHLHDHIAIRGPGSLTWLRGIFDFIPGVSGPQYVPFSPVVLQHDVVRLRRVYRDAGFPRAHVDYEVALDTVRNRVGVTLIVDQGPPLVVDSVDVRVTEAPGTAGDGGIAPPPEIELPDDLRAEWSAFLDRLRGARGRRFGEEERARLVNETASWFGERGYPWASVSVARADTLDSQVVVDLRAVPGPRARVREIVIEGNQQLSTAVLRREIPIRVGDWYDHSKIAEGQSELYEIELVRQALGGIVDGQSQDTTVVVRFRVNEGRPRLIWGRVGWRSESGVGGEAHWTHRDFLGGARTLTVSGNVESGWGGLETSQALSVGVSALVRQPYVFQRTMSASMGPFIRYRDDFRDRSLLFGLESSLMYRKRTLETVTLQHVLSRLRVDDTYQLTPIAEVVEQGDSTFAPVFVKSVFKLNGSYGTLDDRINPTSGFLVEPNVEVTGPSTVSDVEFFRLGLKAMAMVPLGRRTGLFVRGTAGRLFPFGQSDPEEGVSRTRAIVGLRDQMFTAGGTSDVRGFASGLMGSKIPDVSVTAEGTVGADRYVPAGGLARLTGTAELALPFPFLSAPHGTFVFLDAGRVWSPGEVFDPADPELRREGWAYSTGGGLEFGTLVGPIRIAVGYKLNPTPVDLLGPGEVARAIVDGRPLAELEVKSIRRWHLHLSIGRAF